MATFMTLIDRTSLPPPSSRWMQRTKQVQPCKIIQFDSKQRPERLVNLKLLQAFNLARILTPDGDNSGTGTLPPARHSSDISLSSAYGTNNNMDDIVNGHSSRSKAAAKATTPTRIVEVYHHLPLLTCCCCSTWSFHNLHFLPPRMFGCSARQTT